jgi:hypothetical protein
VKVSSPHEVKAEFDLSLSPPISILIKSNGDPCEGDKRKNVETYASVSISRQFLKYWNTKDVLVRELLQNVSDACIRCALTHHR